MAEKSAPEAEDTSSKDFDEGFEGKATAVKTEDKPEDTDKEKSEDKPAPKEKAPAKAEDKPEDKQPEHVQITKEQFDKLMGAAEETASLKSQMSKAFGTIGNVQQHVNRLQAATPKGEPIKLTRAIVAKLEKDFPELADGQFDALEQLVNLINQNGAKGTGTDEAPKAGKDDKDDTAEKFRKEQIERDIESLEDAYPDWKEIVGAVPDGKFDPKHPFRSWLATQPEAYQQKINATTNAAVIERAITRFKASQAEQAKTGKKPEEKPNPQATARKNLLRENVNPRGAGPEPTTRNSPDDDLEEGYRSG